MPFKHILYAQYVNFVRKLTLSITLKNIIQRILQSPKSVIMNNSQEKFPDDLSRVGLPPLTQTEEQLLNIYWCKKELEEFLPQIATYATTKELTAITLSQLAIIEKQILQILKGIANKEIDQSKPGN